MALAVGPITQISVGPTVNSLSVAAATGGVGPYTYQWYRSTTSGFSPGGGNIIAGATALAFMDSGLTPNTTYFYKVVVTDTGNSNATANSAQLSLVTQPPTLSQNQFAETPYLGVVDLRYSPMTVSVQIASTQATPLYPGAAVKCLPGTIRSIPQVVGCSADSDEVMGFINFDIKSQNFPAGARAEISMQGNVIYLYATGAITQMSRVTLDLVTNGGVAEAVPSSGNKIVGIAFDGASGPGQLIRVLLSTPSFTVA